MKENSMEELKQRLEELYKTQQARLDVGADDLDIREEIAEVEEEIKELQDDTNVDRKNSIEEDIEVLEKMIKSYKEADKCGLSNNDFKNEIKALEHILSEYKRLQKENEELSKEIKCKIQEAEKDLQEAIRLEKEAQANEDSILWWTAQIRLDERIKVLKELLKEEEQYVSRIS